MHSIPSDFAVIYRFTSSGIIDYYPATFLKLIHALTLDNFKCEFKL
jgi:hypothetical protein